MLGTQRIKNMAAVLAAIMVCGVLIAGVEGANVPEMINYQGYLEVGGSPVIVPTDMKFRIYDQDVGGTLTWGPETHSQVGFDVGYFSVMLGDAGVPVEAVDLNGSVRWLEIELAPFTGPMTPRIQLTSVPYAHRVATIDGATGGDIYGDVALHSDFTLNGRIGIGTSNPLKDLHISRVDQPSEIRLKTATMDVTGWNAWDIVSYGGKLNFQFHQNQEPHPGYEPTMTLRNTGKVGIGTEYPDYTLDVDGDIRATGTIHGTLNDNHVEYTQVSFSNTEYIVNTSWVRMYTDGTASKLTIENPIGSGNQLVCFHSDNFGNPIGISLSPGGIYPLAFSGAFHDIRIVSETNLLTYSGVRSGQDLWGHVIYND